MVDEEIKIGDKYIDGYGNIITIISIGNPKKDYPTLRNKVGEYCDKKGNPHQCYYTYKGISWTDDRCKNSKADLIRKI